MADHVLNLPLRSQRLERNAQGYNVWRLSETVEKIPAREVSLVLCDVWDAHWSRGAQERLEALVPRMGAVIETLRDRGAFIVHAPSDTMAFYAGHPARKRMLRYPSVALPDALDHPDPPLPIDDSDHGSDTDDSPSHPWRRQHPGIEIDAQRDLISDSGREIYAFLKAEGIGRVLIMGVHTNMCILNRSFAIKQMVRWGVPIALVRDLTDAMYNPAMPPYVSHAEGTRLVIEYIEKHWCPTVASEALLESGTRGLS